ncbi:MAG: GvpL/GvpF family gas vesicle protein [Acidobacteriota bacterium]
MYIYGIIETNEEKYFGSIGITADEEVYTISHKDIAACVSDSLNVNYSSLMKDTLIKFLMRHQFVIENIMKNYTIIPVKFGTTVSGNEDVQEVLRKGYREFKDTLRYINGKIELDIVVSFDDLDSILKEIGEISEIKKFKEEVLSKSSKGTLEDMIKVGAMVKKVLDRQKNECNSQILNFLKSEAIEFRRHEVIMDDSMILNCAFLLDKNKEREFDQRIKEVDQKFGGRLNFRCIGPLPPYSFSTVEIKKVEFEALNKAMNTLGLSNKVTQLEMKKAYRKLAFKYHPDKNLHNPETRSRFAELNNAYKLLSLYCHGSKHSFEKEKAGDFISVRIIKDLMDPRK